LIAETSEQLLGIGCILSSGNQGSAILGLIVPAAIHLQQIRQPALAVGGRFGRARFVQAYEQAFQVGIVEMCQQAAEVTCCAAAVQLAASVENRPSGFGNERLSVDDIANPRD
jgi:hypothetical protein